MTNRTRACRLLAAGCFAAAAVAGCDRPEEPAPAPAPITAPEPAPPSAWREVDGSRIVAVAADDERLRAAMREARRTAPAARGRWAAMDEAGRARWAIKWAAPTVDGGREYVWMRPVAWSPFRIEGRLASPPQRMLESGRVLGDLVSFPHDELADWFLENGAQHEGGFTLRVLDEHFGAP
jgi:uncharacterized protein YegJ (DUF2314 family)